MKASEALARIGGLDDLTEDARGLLQATLLASKELRPYDEAEAIVRRLAERHPENARLADWHARLKPPRLSGE